MSLNYVIQSVTLNGKHTTEVYHIDLDFLYLNICKDNIVLKTERVHLNILMNMR